MAHIDALIDKVADPSLRHALREQVDAMLTKQSFGLVFQQHKPETVELSNYKVRRGCKVRIRSNNDQQLYRVQSVRGRVATIVSSTDQPQSWDIDPAELVVVREFGDPLYPGLRRTGRVERGGEKPSHLVINAENFHALEMLLYTHENKVDAIYIDPPYNTRDKDWKYNNDYVDSDDVYRHSKWLAFMERRLKLANRLLDPVNSVLIVTIDEKEYLRLGMLLEQIFPEARIQMVSATINPKGTSRPRMFSRVDEFIFFVLIGDAAVPDVMDEGAAGKPVRWRYLRREDEESIRGSRPRQFYPVFVDPDTAAIADVGEPIAPDVPASSVEAPDGLVAVFPIREDGKEMEWGLTGPSLMKAARAGFARATPGHAMQPFIISYLTAPSIKKLEAGELQVSGTRADGSKIVVTPGAKASRPKTVWRETRHSAGDYGTKMLGALIPDRRFPFPKSVYAVEDTLRFFVGDKPEATVLDFFAGSGTTAHAVMRLNHADGGRRRCILVTNNEVSADEAAALRNQGYQPGDDEWEALGICELVTKPRVRAAITGRTPDGDVVQGDYKFVDEFPMSEGFEENAEFFSLTYEDPDLISLGRKFEAVAPLLWLKAGGYGAIIGKAVKDWTLPDGAIYGVLFDTDQWREFVDAIIKREYSVRHAYVVTDSDAAFQHILSELPAGVASTQLYSDYLRTFEINTKGRA
ncbi:site-specific DNA-methyltransferase [Kribbella sp. NPDC058245]|uniref:site-specific DNA-methyltransferase n=1 Tax=Kribbella sp. NPDC058245 TaxID=3346399 RepID=UPI0036E26BEE